MSIKSRRAVLIILDGVGVGALEDAAAYGDAGANTLLHVAAACDGLPLRNLERLGINRLLPGRPGSPDAVVGACGRMREQSSGKDSITGHWELAGVVLSEPFATYPQGFPRSLVEQFATLSGALPLGNVPASGISILKRFGSEHVRTGRPILYTSVDSVFQIAAHEDVLPLPELYRLCRRTRDLVDNYAIGRVIARPFTGDERRGFRRTPNRKDFSMPPPEATLLDRLTDASLPVVGVGKVADLFAGRGISVSHPTGSNLEGMAKVVELFPGLESGLLVANLIDFDMVYGHRRDASGFGRALQEFDAWLPELMARLVPGDLLMVTADHGCDPTTAGTDHSREYVPILAWHPELATDVDLGTRQSFADVGATLADFFGLEEKAVRGESFLPELCLETPSA